MEFLSEAYPVLYNYILRYLKLTKRQEQYHLKCLELEDHEDPNKYCIHVHGYYADWLEQQRSAGKVFYGKLARMLIKKLQEGQRLHCLSPAGIMKARLMKMVSPVATEK